MQSPYRTFLPPPRSKSASARARARALPRLSPQSRHMHNLVVLTSSLLVLRGKLPLCTPRRGETRDIQIARAYVMPSRRTAAAITAVKVESESTNKPAARDNVRAYHCVRGKSFLMRGHSAPPVEIKLDRSRRARELVACRMPRE